MTLLKSSKTTPGDHTMYRVTINFNGSKIYRFYVKFEHEILEIHKLNDFSFIPLKLVTNNLDILLAVHNFSMIMIMINILIKRSTCTVFCF